VATWQVPARFAGRWWRRSGALALTVLIAAVPVAGAIADLEPVVNGSRQADGLLIGVLVALTVLVVAGLALVVRQVARRRGVRTPGAVAAVLVIAQAATMVLLGVVAPFRPGLVSSLLYAAPAVLLARAALGGGRRSYAWWAAAVAGVVAVAVPAGLLQRALGVWEWTQPGGVPSRAWPQVIDLPGMPQEPYQWDERSGVLTAYFDAWIDPSYQWGAIETVISDRSAPPAILTWADGDGADQLAATCTRQRPGLWQCTTQNDQGAVGFVRQSGR